MKQKKKIFIVGAGISGLYLASMLEDKYEVTILEARDRIGGRVHSIDGHDMGPSWVWPHHKNMLSLLEKLELRIFTQHTKGYALFDTKDKVEMFNPEPAYTSYRVEGSLSLCIDGLHNTLQKTNIIFNQNLLSLEDKKDSVNISTNTNTYEADIVILTQAPRLCAKVLFQPALPLDDLNILLKTQTWMGNSAKCVIEFKSAFWRQKDLSGFVFSHMGPLGEIHDASTKEVPSLFGFLSSSADMENFDINVRTQVKRIFQINDDEILKIHLVDWREEIYTSSTKDSEPLREHPQYGIDLSHFNSKVLFSSTEFSFEEGGYLEGALIRAKKVTNTLLKI